VSFFFIVIVCQNDNLHWFCAYNDTCALFCSSYLHHWSTILSN
jgi:hypothetical protein